MKAIEADFSNSTVLVVDDDATFRGTLAEAVRAWGYRALEAATLAETLTIVDRQRLEEQCCECYAVVKKETDRLLAIAP